MSYSLPYSCRTHLLSQHSAMRRHNDAWRGSLRYRHPDLMSYSCHTHVVLMSYSCRTHVVLISSLSTVRCGGTMTRGRAACATDARTSTGCPASAASRSTATRWWATRARRGSPRRSRTTSGSKVRSAQLSLAQWYARLNPMVGDQGAAWLAEALKDDLWLKGTPSSTLAGSMVPSPSALAGLMVRLR